MDLIVTSNFRPLRLMGTLGSVLAQDIPEPKNLILVDNTQEGLLGTKPIEKMLAAFKRSGWSTDVVQAEQRTISEVKHFALSQGSDELIIAIDNDLVFTRPDTIATMLWTLRHYDVAAVSPLAYDVDDERPILENDAYTYGLAEPDRYGVAEGLTALGLCLGLRRAECRIAMSHWCLEFPYLEDQILVFFLKKARGYAHLHNHAIYHLSISEPPSYRFDHDEVMAFLSAKARVSPSFAEILELRRNGRDAAFFRKSVHPSCPPASGTAQSSG